MKQLQRLSLLGGAFVLAYALAPSTSTALVPVNFDDDDIVVTGCIVRGDDDEGLLLAHALPVASGATTGRAVGTTGAVRESGQTLYWLEDLDDDDELPNYVGRRVEIRGELEGDVETGEMEIERDGDWVNVEIKSDGKKVKSRLPLVALIPANSATATGTTGAALPDDDEIELKVLVRKVDVKDVRVVAGTCDVQGR